MELEETLLREESMWMQRSRNVWLKEGAHNTKIFHSRVTQHWKKNAIKHLQRGDRSWTTNEDQIEEEVINFFTSLFQLSNPSNSDIDQVLASVDSVMTEEMNGVLTRIFTSDQVETALGQMHPLKSPADGFLALFSRNFGA